MEITKEQEKAVTREIDDHGVHLKASIEASRCAGCGEFCVTELNPRNITFRCQGVRPCGWAAIYPIRTLGNSERAERDEVLDLIAISEREVLEKGREWLRLTRAFNKSYDGYDPAKAMALADAQAEVLGALVLLESREENTKHREPVKGS